MAIAYRDLIMQLLAEIGDPAQESLSDSFALSLVELCLNIVQLTLRPLVATEAIVYPVPGIFLSNYIPIANANLLQRVSDNSLLKQLMLVITTRDSNYHELARNSLETLGYFSDSLSTLGDVTEYYLILSNLLGLRRVPASDPGLSITYIAYIEIFDIEAPFPLDDSFILPMLQLMHFFNFIRLSQFEAAKAELQRFTSLVKGRYHARPY